jgi:hypothetical protein
MMAFFNVQEPAKPSATAWSALGHRIERNCGADPGEGHEHVKQAGEDDLPVGADAEDVVRVVPHRANSTRADIEEAEVVRYRRLRPARSASGGSADAGVL